MKKGSGFWWVVGGVIMLALVATVLAKNNTSGVITSAGNSFSGLLKSATAG